jgi:hypothetical protein
MKIFIFEQINCYGNLTVIVVAENTKNAKKLIKDKFFEGLTHNQPKEDLSVELVAKYHISDKVKESIVLWQQEYKE